jgi:hypothetical protein
MKAVNFVYRTVASCLALGAVSVASAAATPFNPDNLNATQLTHVADVCQTVLGLSPKERLQGGNRIGDDRLDYWTNHYQGCILSLSDSLRTIAAARTLGQLAGTAGTALPAGGGRFMFASPREVARREELACSLLGIDLSGAEINNCVHGLSQTFYMVDHTIE